MYVPVTGVPGSGKTTLGRTIAAALALPLLSKDVIKESLYDALGALDRAALSQAATEVIWALLPQSPAGAVVDIWLDPRRDVGIAQAGLAAAGVSDVVEVMCSCPGDVSVQRYLARPRHGAHLSHADEATLQRIRDSADLMAPLGVGPTLTVDTTQPLDSAQITAWLGQLRREMS